MNRPLIALGVALVGVLAGCAAAPDQDGAGRTSDTSSEAPSDPATNPAGDSAEVVRVLDGDSAELVVEGEIAEVRLIGINAPERDECYGDRARDTLEQLLSGNAISLTADASSDSDQFGRMLRYVSVDGVDVNAEMLASGAAVALQSGHDRQAAYVELSDTAVRDRIGMWASDACGSFAPAEFEIIAIEYDPAGPDQESTIREWVEITNVGDQAVDLSGWTVRDESSTHRFVFGSVRIEPGERTRIRSGCGDDRGLDVVWCAGDAVWNNRGDTVILQDPLGNVVAIRRYDESEPTARFAD